MNRSYKFRIYPTKKQEEQIQRTFGCCRFVYNHYLSERIHKWFDEGVNFNYYKCHNDLTLLKKEFVWLKEVDSTALQSSLVDLEYAFKRFFSADSKGKRNAYPKYKAKKNHSKSYRTVFVTGNIAVKQNAIKLPKLGLVKCKVSKEVQGKILNATVSQRPSGKYYVSVCCSDVNVDCLDKTGAVVGIDLGLKTLITTSDGQSYENIRSLSQDLKRLRMYCRRMSRKKFGGENYEKARIKMATLSEKISNRRRDYIQKSTTDLIRKYDIICIESLRAKGFMKNRRISRSALDASFGEIKRELKYKAEWYGKTIQEIGAFFPSSQLCHCCGYRNAETKNLSVREWVCPICGKAHERDHNAAINILNEGLRLLA